MMERLLRGCNRHDGRFRLVLFFISLYPAAQLWTDFGNNGLGFNPFESLMARTGFWAMVFLLLTLAITPLRRWLGFSCKVLRLSYGKRLADWNFLIKSRRMLGLFSFFYLSWHLAIYLHLELNWRPDWLWQDLLERPFLDLGMIAWVISFLLAITSPLWLRRRMGKNWRRLHRLMYPLCLLAVAHVVLEAKITQPLPLTYSGIVAILLVHRILTAYFSELHRPEDTRLEAER